LYLAFSFLRLIYFRSTSVIPAPFLSFPRRRESIPLSLQAPLWVRGNLVILFCHCEERSDAAIPSLPYVIRSTFLSFSLSLCHSCSTSVIPAKAGIYPLYFFSYFLPPSVIANLPKASVAISSSYIVQHFPLFPLQKL